MELLVHGCQNKEIAATLRISLFTVATHMVNIFEKLPGGGTDAPTRWAVYVQSIRCSKPSADLGNLATAAPFFRQREVLEMLRTGQRNKDINERSA